MSTSNGKSYPKGTASTCHDVSMTQVSETPRPGPQCFRSGDWLPGCSLAACQEKKQNPA